MFPLILPIIFTESRDDSNIHWSDYWLDDPDDTLLKRTVSNVGNVVDCEIFIVCDEDDREKLEHHLNSFTNVIFIWTKRNENIRTENHMSITFQLNEFIKTYLEERYNLKESMESLPFLWLLTHNCSWDNSPEMTKCCRNLIEDFLRDQSSLSVLIPFANGEEIKVKENDNSLKYELSNENDLNFNDLSLLNNVRDELIVLVDDNRNGLLSIGHNYKRNNFSILSKMEKNVKSYQIFVNKIFPMNMCLIKFSWLFYDCFHKLFHEKNSKHSDYLDCVWRNNYSKIRKIINGNFFQQILPFLSQVNIMKNLFQNEKKDQFHHICKLLEDVDLFHDLEKKKLSDISHPFIPSVQVKIYDFLSKNEFVILKLLNGAIKLLQYHTSNNHQKNKMKQKEHQKKFGGKNTKFADDLLTGQSVIIVNSFISTNVSIGDNTKITDSFIARNCRIGKNVKLVNCFIKENSVIEDEKEMSYIS
ncbi:hypothetical protein SNEBB_005538 [Seison nebaliae]|nr:hypothetical protein SNEBB_005538 [Seison nebaliae]